MSEKKNIDELSIDELLVLTRSVLHRAPPREGARLEALLNEVEQSNSEEGKFQKAEEVGKVLADIADNLGKKTS